ncbi:MAG TPA: hypothetical protein VJT31_35040 [Rugosimonospora sp.]|nr:hypothetical protein [Rugosimonospora sp.]
MPVPVCDVATIARTRAFFEALARGCDSDVEQIEVALAHLAELELDEQTLDGFQSAQEDAARAAARCRSTVAVLDARQALLEDAVNATPDAAKTDFYQEGGVSPTTAGGGPDQAAAHPGVQGVAPTRPPLGDKLKIARRIQLDDGETLIGSGKYSGEDGTVRWALVRRPDGSPALRLGVGDGTFGTDEDQCGPWNGGPDETEAINAERRALSEEYDRAEDRLAEIEAANTIAELRGDDPTVTLTDLVAERDRIRVRLDEILEHDRALGRARERERAGEAVDPAELNPPRYCEPGEFDRLLNRWKRLQYDLPSADVWDKELRPPQPGEADALNQRCDELEAIGLNEVCASGFTTRLGLPAVEQARQDLAGAVDRAEAKCQAINAWWDEHDRLEDAGDPDALAAHKATEREWEYEVFTDARVPGEWGDLAYRVELDDPSCGVDILLGVVPHGSTTFTDLDEVSGAEAGCRLKAPEARKLISALGQVTGSAGV